MTAPRFSPLRLMASQPLAAGFGFVLLALVLPACAMQMIDLRLLGGASVWLKPTKFLVSIGIFALTAAWFAGHVRPERRGSIPVVLSIAFLVIGGMFEIGYIGFQGWQGEASHFNKSTPFHATMYSLMGFFAVMLITSTLPLAWEIARRPGRSLSREMQVAIVIGLLLTFMLGGTLGGMISVNGGHAVGPEGQGIWLLGWNRLGGDLRVPHFLGIHAEQAIPLLTYLSLRLPARFRMAAIVGGAVVWTGITLLLFLQASAGLPLFPV